MADNGLQSGNSSMLGSPHKGGNPWHDPKNGRFTTNPDGDDKTILTITGHRPVQHWRAKNPSVKVPDQIRSKLDAVAKAFHDATGKVLVVTDGARTPEQQAERMYYKYAHGDFRTYRGNFAAKIANAYREGVKNNLSRDQILTKMAAIVTDSVNANQPISYHLANRAVDFSSKYLSSVDKSVLKLIIAKNGGVPLHEGVPEHIHATFRKD